MFKSSLQGRGNALKRKSSEGNAGPPVKKQNSNKAPTDPKPEVRPSTPETAPAKTSGYTEVSTLEKLQSVEDILMDLRDRKCLQYFTLDINFMKFLGKAPTQSSEKRAEKNLESTRADEDVVMAEADQDQEKDNTSKSEKSDKKSDKKSEKKSDKK